MDKDLREYLFQFMATNHPDRHVLEISEISRQDNRIYFRCKSRDKSGVFYDTEFYINENDTDLVTKLKKNGIDRSWIEEW